MNVRLLQTGDAALVEIIRERIRGHGPVSFAWFMEQALYHPKHGYYSSGRCRIGRDGDYFTSVSVGPLFGQLMAEQFAEMWRALGKPAEFAIVEQGAHDGQFAHDVLTAARDRHPDFFAAAHYQIVEPLAKLRDRQIKTLVAFAPRVSWCASLDELAPFCGVHFSNELLDALPMHLVRFDGEKWLERQVTLSGDAFAFEDAPVADQRLQAQLAQIPSPRTAGYTTEVSLARLSFIDTLARKLKRGFVLAVDYGFARDDFYAPHRTSGTLQCRAQHRMVPSPLLEVGHADITAHVDWTSIAERGEAAGLSLLGFTDQHHFITGLLASAGGMQWMETQDAKQTRELQTLLHPGFVGMKFQFLVLGKAVENTAILAGLRFARNLL